MNKSYAILIVAILLTFFIRLLTFGYSPTLQDKITITNYTLYNESFYTSTTNNINFSFSSNKKIQIGNVITYQSSEFDEQYKSYSLKSIKVVGQDNSFKIKLQRILKTTKENYLKSFKSLFSKTAYQLSSGTLLGEKSVLDSEFKQNLVDTGLIHVVVVSGFNISLVGLMVIEILKKFGYKISLFGGILAIIIYATFVGLEPPVLRAVIMGTIVIVARLKGKESKNIYSLILVGMILVFINPLIITSLSFQLSFLATLGILIFTPMFDKFIPRFLADLSASISAQIFVIPIIAYNFQTISIISPITNLLTLWTIPLITVFSAVILLTYYIFPSLAFALTFLVEVPSKLIEIVVTNFADLKFASINVDIGVIQVVLLYLLVGLLFFALRLLQVPQEHHDQPSG